MECGRSGRLVAFRIPVSRTGGTAGVVDDQWRIPGGDRFTGRESHSACACQQRQTLTYRFFKIPGKPDLCRSTATPSNLAIWAGILVGQASHMPTYTRPVAKTSIRTVRYACARSVGGQYRCTGRVATALPAKTDQRAGLAIAEKLTQGRVVVRSVMTAAASLCRSTAKPGHHRQKTCADPPSPTGKGRAHFLN